MYCIKCGVKLGDSEQRCPLCQTVVYHPQLARPEGEKLYPEDRLPQIKFSLFPAVLLTALFLLPILTILLCDLQLCGGITWSGYVMGALLLVYVIAVLPMWFPSPNPVIFVPCGFLATALYLHYICFAVGGSWFWVFALPTLGGGAVVVTTLVVLTRYIKKGWLYMFGGAFIGLGVFMLPVELLAGIAFHVKHFVGWSFYPLMALVLLGGVMIFLAIYTPARETVQRKLFF